MRSCLVEVGCIRTQDAVELLLMQDEQMIEALTSHTAQESLTDGIGSRGVIGGFENLDATCLSNLREGHSKLVVLQKISGQHDGRAVPLVVGLRQPLQTGWR
jgi:hypothetical protein